METEKLKELWFLAFREEAAVIDAFFSAAYAPERCLYLTEKDKLTAALYWMDTEYDGRVYAYIYGVATHPDHRGQGLCRKLMAKTHAYLASQCYTGALLVPARQELRQMYGNMGYRDCGGIREFGCMAGPEGTPVRRISQDEYAALRRTYLPEGGVIQEKENLTYLQTYAELFAGDDFLLAAASEQDRLLGLELLGNSACAPRILRAMGYPQGTFRTPGSDKPYAMYHPLQENAPVPRYFGLGFD